MLSIVPMKQSNVKTSYYLKEDGNYHIENVKEKELYQWFGEGSREQGLSGDIDPGDHKRVFNGCLPSGDVVGKRTLDGDLTGRPGYDFTFSSNKDISLIVCCTKDDSLRDYFLNAHGNAVKTAMLEVEKIASARKSVSKDRVYETTGNMIASLCTHFSSREGDPQLHTHSLVANATKRSDGKWRALSTDLQGANGFYEKASDYATYFGHIYQHEMARAAKEKGFEVSPIKKHGMFEIKGFPSDVREYFSKRREQILHAASMLKNANANDKLIMSKVARATRAPKDSMGRIDFMAQSRSFMDDYFKSSHHKGDFDSCVASCMTRKEKTINEVSENAKDIIIESLESLSRFHIKMDFKAVLDKAMVLGLKQGEFTFLEAKNALNEIISEGRVHRLTSGELTSQALIDKEKSFLGLVKRSVTVSYNNIPKKNPTIPQLIKHSRLVVIKEPKSLSKKQEGINRLINDLEGSGKKVTLLTQSNSIAHEYNGFYKEEGASLWRQLVSIGKSDRAVSVYGFLHSYETLTSSGLRNKLAKKGKEVLIVEDINSLGFETAERLITMSEKRGARLVFLSYDEGRKSPLPGNVSALLTKSGIPTSKGFGGSNEKKEISYRIHEVTGGVNAGLKESRECRQEKLALDLVDSYGRDFGAIQVFSVGKKAVATQTKAIRDALKEENLLSNEERVIRVERPVYLHKGDRKNASSFKEGCLVKTYIGHGQFETKKILGVNEKTNQVLLELSFGRRKYVSPAQVLKNKSRLFESSEMSLSPHEHVFIKTENRVSKRLGLSPNTHYELGIDGDKATLTPNNEKLKTLHTKIKKLDGLDLRYAYVKEISELKEVRPSGKRAILDAPAYSLNKNTLNDLSRRYIDIDIYTDNKSKAEKKMNLHKSVELASDLTLLEPNQVATAANKALDFALSVVGGKEASFTYQRLLDASMTCVGESFSFQDVMSALKQRVRQGDIIARKHDTGDVFLATKEAVALESDIINQIKRGKGAVDPFLDKEVIGKRLQNTALTQGQKDACTLIASTSDRFVMIQGYAGTGKSTMLKTLKEELASSGRYSSDSIIALAPTHKAVSELLSKGMEAQTLKSFLVSEKDHMADNSSHLNGKLIILDESSMVSNKDFKALQDIVEKAESCRCAYIGDKAQLLSVESGKPSEIAYTSKEAGMSIAIMDEVLRQKNPDLKAISKHLMEDRSDSMKTSFSMLKAKGWSRESENPIADLAKAYSELSKEHRSETLIAAATNKNRSLINKAVREALIAKGDISGPLLQADSLHSSRLTRSQLKRVENYREGDVIKISGEYADVVTCRKEENALTIQKKDLSMSHLDLDSLPSNKPIELFKKERLAIQAGDTLKWTKSDQNRGVTAHNNMTVTSVNQEKGLMKVITASGDNRLIDTKKKQNMHIDYGYASTVHGLQGATAKSVMILLDKANRKANSSRLMYVATTRATHKAEIFSNNLKEVEKQMSSKKGESKSALEAMGLLDEKIPEITNINKRKEAKSNKSIETTKESIEEKSDRLDASLIEAGLKASVKSVCQDLLGDPNKHLSNPVNWRYGRKGSLSVSVSGEKQGMFCNFERDEKGGMISLIMSELGMEFKDALRYGHKLLGGSSFKHIIPERRKDSDAALPEMPKAPKNNEYVKSIMKRCGPIGDDATRKYLTGRSILDWQGADIQSIGRTSTGGGNKDTRAFSSAMASFAKNKEGDVTAVQLTYLDPLSGEKIHDLPVQKRTIGSTKGSFVTIMPFEETTKTTFVAEGVETALSVSESLKNMNRHEPHVVASLGKSNLKNIADIDSAKNIVLVLDNDGVDWKKDKTLSLAVASIEAEGKHVFCMQPNLINSKKTDYNDLAKAGEFKDIEADIQAVLSNIESPEKSNNYNHSNRTGRPLSQGDREIIG